MKRVILDTNIYGLIVEKEHVEEVKELSRIRRDIVIYGFDIIRHELRNVSKNTFFRGHKLRVILLNLYDRMVKNHALQKTRLVENLASDYYSTYIKLFGYMPKERMFNDFLIVACASINELDIVVSEDNKTMLSEYAIKTYDTVNSLRTHKTPKFIRYEEFRRLFS